jgi:hypothetical protein
LRSSPELYNQRLPFIDSGLKFTMLKLAAIFFFLINFSFPIKAQNPFEIGGEYMRIIGHGYNSTKVGGRAETFNNKSSYSVGITYQLASTETYSVSSGFGIYIGYRHAFGNSLTGNPFVGARVLFSFENFEGKTSHNSLMITPIGEAGYHFIFAKKFFGAPSIGYGYTIKFSKDYNSLDEDAGGRIMPSISAGYRF